MKKLSVIIPVCSRYADIEPLYAEYRMGLDQLGIPYELVFALDGPHPSVATALERFVKRGDAVTVVQLTRPFGEAATLMAALEHATGDAVLTLPAYHQIQSIDLGRMVAALGDTDLVIGYRSPRAGGALERFRRWAFHALLGWVTNLRFHDLGCSARLMRRHVLEEIRPYGDQHRFLAVLADRLGFKVREVPLRQSPQDRFRGHYRAREYAHQLLDIFNVFFLVRFTKRPLRFFGSLGAIMFGLGTVVILALIADRLFFDVSLGDRPLLLLSSLLAVLGMQLFALGLLGELIIFTHAGDMKDYRIDQIVEQEGPETLEAEPDWKAGTVTGPRTPSRMPQGDGGLRIPTITAS